MWRWPQCASTNKNYIVWKANFVDGAGERAVGMYSVSLQRASSENMVTSDGIGDILSVWHAMLTHADRNDIRKMGQIGAVHGLEMVEVRITNNCSPCVEGRMTNMPMRSGITLESCPGAVLHTIVARMNVPSIGETNYFVTLLDKASEYVRVCHRKTKGEASELLKRHVRCFVRQTYRRVRKVVLDRGNDYFKETNEL